MKKAILLLPLTVVLLFAESDARAQYVPAQLALTQLPQEHPYQKTLRAYLGTLQEKDLTLERQAFTAPAADLAAEEQYRLWLLTLNLPQVQAAALPPTAFTLRALEANKGLALPATPADAQMLAWLAGWKQAGNPYHGSRALKLRAFVLAVVDLVMLDYLYEHEPQGSDRSDFLGGNLIWLGYTAKIVQDVLPAEVRSAFHAGLKKHVLRLQQWGPRGAMTDMDLFAPVGLWYCAQALGDAEVSKVAEAYARRLFTEERFFHPAGYFVDAGCFDTSYNGISLYFATWAALASDWPFAREAVAKAFRLRAHLCLPEPDGQAFFGPSHMSSRTSADPPRDQWNFPHRPYAAAQVTDEALHLAPLPAVAVLRQAPVRVLQHLTGQLDAVPPVKAEPWKETHWSGARNFAYDHYQPGHYARRLKLEQEGSPLLKPLYQRGEAFVRAFDEAFVIARFDTYAAVLHTGPIRGWPYGLGGGMVSAYWTPSAGTTLLGRRRGMQGSVRDEVAEWRTWPIHALSGTTADGEFFTSASIRKPDVKVQLAAQSAEATVAGPIALGKNEQALQYQRRFRLHPTGLSVQTTVRGTGKLAELYETVPVFLHELSQVKEAHVKVQLQVGATWVEATPAPQAQVQAVRIERCQGAVLLTFDRPRSVRLAPRDWTDGFQTRATCRTLQVDLLDSGGQAKAIESAAVEYTLAPVPQPAKP